MVATDIAVDRATGVWSAYVTGKIEECRARDLATESERRECLGPAADADKVQAALTSIVIAQGVYVEALKVMREIAPLLEAAQ